MTFPIAEEVSILGQNAGVCTLYASCKLLDSEMVSNILTSAVSQAGRPIPLRQHLEQGLSKGVSISRWH